MATKDLLHHSHKPALDKFSPAMIRVLAEFLLYTMDIEQRTKLKDTYPGLYSILEPETPPQ